MGSDQETGRGVLSVTLLGRPALTFEGQELITTLRYRRSMEVLTYLSVENGRWHGRAAMADFFWPHLELSSGRTNLRQVISDLKTLFLRTGCGALKVSNESVGLFLDHTLNVDTVALERVMGGTALPVADAEDTGKLGGILLDRAEKAPDDASPFNEWLLVQRQRYLLMAMNVIEARCDRAELKQDWDTALSLAHRLVELDPTQEAAQRRLMRLLARKGQKSAALRQFETLRSLMATEMDASPSRETTVLLETIRGETFSSHTDAPPETGQPVLDGLERRVLSCFYCELIPRMSRHSVEELTLEKLMHARQTVIATIREYGGFVSNIQGAGIFAYFGFPRAQKQATIQAVAAAQTIVDALAADIEPRIGIHSTSVMVDHNQEVPDVFGQASELAMRLRLVGEVGHVTVDGATREASRREFEFEALGGQTLRGMQQTIQAWRLQGPAMCPSRQGMGQIIGREHELRTLVKNWNRVRQGDFRCVVVEGEAGIGKTRLADALTGFIGSPQVTVLSLGCLPESQNTPLGAIKRLVEGRAGVEAHDPMPARLGKIKAWLAEHWQGNDLFDSSVLMRFFAGPDQTRALETWQLGSLFTSIIDAIRRLAASRPLLLKVEDIHWLDRTGYQLLLKTLDALGSARAPILLLLTQRSPSSWPELEGRVEHLPLKPLNRPDTHRMLCALDERRDLTESARHALAERSIGIPLFIEDLFVHHKTSQSYPSAVSRELPVSLQLLFQERIDALGEDKKQLLMVGSAIGLQFTIRLLRAICSEAAELEASLEIMCGHNLLLGEPDRYQFRHEMIRQAAYDMLPSGRRQELHGRIAGELILDDGIRDTEPELIAYHFERAGEALTAARWWHHAGITAMRLQNVISANEHFTKALKLMDPGDEACPQDLRLDLLLDFSEGLIKSEGYSSAPARLLLDEALQLAERLEDSQARFRAMNGLWLSDRGRPEVTEDLTTARGLYALAITEEQKMVANLAMGNTLFWHGRFAEATAHLEEAVISGQSLGDVSGFMVDHPLSSARAILCWALWFLGRDEDARATLDAGLAASERQGQHHATCYLLTFGASLLRCQGDVDGTAELARQLRRRGARYAFPVWENVGHLHQAWARAHTGKAVDRSLLETEFNRLLEGYGGIRITTLSIMAETYMALGEWAMGLNVLDRAVALTGPDIQEAYFHAEIHRLRAVCHWELGPCSADQIGSDLTRALEIAEKQGSPALLERARASQKRWLAGEMHLTSPGEALHPVINDHS